MIINQKIGDVITIGDVESKKATISSDNIGKLQYILTEGLYKDPISATIVEITNNGMDSIIESGKDPYENPVKVVLTTNSLTISDNGIGMSSDFFENQFMSILTSTKEKSNTSIGYYGIGGKSWASLKKSVTFLIRKDGIECKYLCYRGTEFIEYDKLYEMKTDLENGVIFSLPLGPYEYSDYLVKAQDKLGFYDTVVLIANGKMLTNHIHRSELYQTSSMSPSSTLRLCLKDVVYNIDFTKLNIAPVLLPISLRFSLDSGITPTPSREDFLYTVETVKLIKDTIKTICNKFVNDFNGLYDWEYTNFIKYYTFSRSIAGKSSISIGAHQLRIQDIEKYGDVMVKTPIFKNVLEVEVASDFVLNSIIGARYEIVGSIINGTYVHYTDKSRRYYRYSCMIGNSILIRDTPLIAGVKSYLLANMDKKKTYYITKNRNEKFNYTTKVSNKKLFDKEALEIINQISDDVVDITNIENEQYYIAFKEKIEEERKEERKKLRKDRLNSVKDKEIAVYSNPIDFKIKKLSDIVNDRKITVYEAKSNVDFTFFKELNSICNNVNFISILKTSFPLMVGVKNAYSYKNFMERKQFRIVASAAYATELIAVCDKLRMIDNELLFSNKKNEAVCYDNIKKYLDSKRREYNTVSLGGAGVDFKKDLINVAKQHNYLDPAIASDLRKLDDYLDAFKFLDCVNVYNGKQFAEFVKNYLILRKLHGEKVNGFKIIREESTPPEEESEKVIEIIEIQNKEYEVF